jgi:hypothetical protein
MGRSAAIGGTHRTASSATLSTKGILGYNVHEDCCIGMQVLTPPLNVAKVLPYDLELLVSGCPRVYVTRLILARETLAKGAMVGAS